MSLTTYLPFAIALGIAAAIPGPGIAALVGKALGSGFRPAGFFLMGLMFGDITFLVLAVLGLAVVAHTFSGVFLIIKLAGAAYLIWLAWHFWHAGIDPARIDNQTGSRFWPSFLSGYFITLGNPKAIIFYMALLPTVVDLNAVGLVEFAELSVIAVIVLAIVGLPYIALASKARTFLTNPRALKNLNRGAATAMAGAAAFIVAKG